jgi:hypothetical protein
MVHAITYELAGMRLPDETAKFESTIKALGDAFAVVKNSWLVECELSNQEISERLAGLLRPKDRLIVTRVYRDWSAANIAPEEADWLAGRNFTSVNDPPLAARPLGNQFPTVR